MRKVTGLIKMGWKDTITPIANTPVQATSSKSWKDSITNLPEEENLGTNIEDVAKGVGQGATLNFGDELLAGLKAGGETLVGQGNASLDNLAKRYRQYQLENEASFKKSKERSPYLTGAGELVGGMAAAGPLGLASKGLTLGQLAARGAAAAGAAGLGGTEGSIADHPEEALKNTAFGATAGAIVPVVADKVLAPASKAVGNFISDTVSDSPILRQHLKSFTTGFKGEGYTGDSNQERLAELAQEGASKLQKQLETGQEFVTGKYGEALKSAGNLNLQGVDTKAFDGLEGLLGKNDPLNAVVENIKNGSVNAQELKALQKELRDGAASALANGSYADRAIGKQLQVAAERANTILHEKVPGYSEVNELFKNFKEPVESFLTNVPGENMSVGSQPKAGTLDTKIFTNARQAIEKSALPFQEGKKQFEQLGQLRSGFEDLAKTKQGQEVLQKMGITDIPEYYQQIQNQADIQSIGKNISGKGSLNAAPTLTDLLGKGTYGSANFLGQGVGFIPRKLGVVNPLASASKDLFKASPEQLTEVSSALKTSMPWLSQKLDEALQNKSQAGINSALFIIMQNPNARKAVFGDNESDTKQDIPGVVK